MESSAALPTPPRNPLLPAFFSLIIPGSGQLFLRARQQGALILTSAILQGLLISWSFKHLNVGKITLGSLTTSWLWGMLALFWAWNVYDSYVTAQGKRHSQFFPVFISLLVVYVVAWQVTNVRLDRLITRWGNALKILNDVIHPDLTTRDPSGKLIPSENFNYIFGTFAAKPAPDFVVQLGLVKPGATMPVYVAGKIVETI